MSDPSGGWERCGPCYAKLNLNLRVRGRRNDGYHEIETAMVAIDWIDWLQAARAPVLSFRCVPPVTARPEDNLVWRAARALAERLGRSGSGAELMLSKDIPAGAGLGGGSSDVGTALQILADLWGGASHDFLCEIAASLGSDVPFFLRDEGAAICRGRGELVEPVELARELHAVIAVPPVALATAAVYRAWKRPRRPAPELSAEVFARAEVDELAPLVANDLEETAAALEPRVAALLASMRALPFAAVALTGSGSACFGLVRDGDEAAGLVRELAPRVQARVRAVTSLGGGAPPGSRALSRFL